MDAKLILSVDFVAKVILFLGDIMGKTNERREEISHKAKNRHKPQPLFGTEVECRYQRELNPYFTSTSAPASSS